ncbi:MAG TPA: metallophosphoesterase [Bdellovibrionota bacterium]|jgi:3',5'-cyclic AMP phosphodiesterase CpdA|nr:metallophosphoesterase [Bdellovibrionota bacterium]
MSSTKILHISDLHFGRVDAFVEKAFWKWLDQHPVDISVVSGDLTQRAKAREFAAAARFVNALPEPRLVVPGNHDIPLYNLFKRFITRLARYQKYISADLRPIIRTPQVLMAGINTAHSMTIKDGKVTHSQLEHLKNVFGENGPQIKILVTHHPLHLLQATADERVASRSEFAVEILRVSGVDILLSGHYHHGRSGISTVQREARYDAILVQSGTSLSTRYRGQNNSFNVLHVDQDLIEVERFEWHLEEKTFLSAQIDRFVRDQDQWRPDLI